jgi:hypothetical protein
MRSNGSTYVSVVFALLIAYFSYQWWFNPHRAVKRRLGELAAMLSVPANETDLGRVTRLAQLRGFLADNIHVRGGRSQPEFSSRDAVMVAVSGWTPSSGWNVDFVDADVKVDSDSTARAFVTADMTTHDAQTGEPALDSREAQLSLAYLGGDWVVSDVDVKDPPQRPSPR